MPGFDDAWKAVASPRGGEHVADELRRPLLHAVYQQILSHPTNLLELKGRTVQLLTFLAGDGRTNANCWAVDLFFAIGQGWEKDWTDQNLPDAFHAVFALMSEALHDTVAAPEVASDFGCLPEQLLKGANRLLSVRN